MNSAMPLAAAPIESSLHARLVRYVDLQPCVNAFIDARTPGSDQKENFTIIGPGVAENPHQYVHIKEPHGFNIGGARQPPRCTNSLHSHDSEEVFFIHTGTWRFFWGEHGDAGEVVLHAGDTISIPIHVFRGFENVGNDVGFMFAVLGGDDPGHVHWAPHVIERAQGHGLILLESGRLIDTTQGEVVPEGAKSVVPSTREEIAHIRVPAIEEMQARVVPRSTLRPDPNSTLALGGERVIESLIIGAPSPDGAHLQAPIPISHGFSVRLLQLSAGGSTGHYSRNDVEVLFVQQGAAEWRSDTGEVLELTAGDTFTAPIGMAREIRSANGAEFLMVLGGDHPTLARA